MLSLSPFNLHRLGPSSPSGRHHCVGVCQVHFKSIFIGQACRLVLQPSFFLLITFEFILWIGLVLHTLVCAICWPRCADRSASTVLVLDILASSTSTSFFEFTVWAGFRADFFTGLSTFFLQVGVGMQITGGHYFIWLSFTSITARFRRRIWIHSCISFSLTGVSVLMVVRCGRLLDWLNGLVGLWAQDLRNRSVGSCFLESNDFLRKVVFWDVQIAVESHEYGAFNAVKLLQSEASKRAEYGIQSFTINLAETLVGEAVHDSTESTKNKRDQ